MLYIYKHSTYILHLILLNEHLITKFIKEATTSQLNLI